MKDRLNQKNVTILSIVFNTLLMILKILVGFLTGSRALLADGIHTLTDFTSDIAVLWSIRISEAPADGDHLYGHRRFQALVALFIVFLILVAAGGITYDSLVGLAKGGREITSWAPVMVAVLSIILKEILFRLTVYVARCFRNQALLANAWHHRSDAFSSVPVAIGVAIYLVGGHRWHFMDHLVAVALAFVIVGVAWKIGRSAIHELTDRAPSQEVLDKVRSILQSHKEIRDFHAIRARTLGGFVEMDFHILVDPQLTVHEGHEIAKEVKCAIMQNDQSIVNVVVHVEPME